MSKKENKKSQTDKQDNQHKELKRFLITVIVIGTLLFVLFYFFIDIRITHENNMYPSIKDGQLIISLKISEPRTDSVIVYRAGDKVLLGRVFAFEGNEVEVQEDTGISIDGNILYHTIPYDTPLGTLEYPYTVPESSYFVLNDYREDMNDSRTYGAISHDDFIGVVIFTMQSRGF